MLYVFKNICREELPLDFKTAISTFFQSGNQSPHDQCIIQNIEVYK